MQTYPVGGYFCTQILGWAGILIGIGQWLCGKPSPYQHAGLIVTASGDTVEAHPGGARFGHVDDYRGRRLLVVDPVAHWAATRPGVDVLALREAVAVEGDRLRDVGYSWLDYAALALLHLHLPSRWVRNRVETSGHLICSALVDRALTRAGITMFPDRRLCGDVMPSDLAGLADAWTARKVPA